MLNLQLQQLLIKLQKMVKNVSQKPDMSRFIQTNSPCFKAIQFTIIKKDKINQKIFKTEEQKDERLGFFFLNKKILKVFDYQNSR